MIFDQTPFYAEMGGQVADQGWIMDEAGEIVAVVTDVQKAPNGQFMHTVEVKAPMSEGQTFKDHLSFTFCDFIQKRFAFYDDQ